MPVKEFKKIDFIFSESMKRYGICYSVAKLLGYSDAECLTCAQLAFFKAMGYKVRVKLCTTTATKK